MPAAGPVPPNSPRSMPPEVRKSMEERVKEILLQEGISDTGRIAGRLVDGIVEVVRVRRRKKTGRPRKSDRDDRYRPLIYGRIFREMRRGRTLEGAKEIVSRQREIKDAGYSKATLGNVFREFEEKLQEDIASAGMEWPSEVRRTTRKRRPRGTTGA